MRRLTRGLFLTLSSILSHQGRGGSCLPWWEGVGARFIAPAMTKGTASRAPTETLVSRSGRRPDTHVLEGACTGFPLTLSSILSHQGRGDSALPWRELVRALFIARSRWTDHEGTARCAPTVTTAADFALLHPPYNGSQAGIPLFRKRDLGSSRGRGVDVLFGVIARREATKQSQGGVAIAQAECGDCRAFPFQSEGMARNDR